MQDEKRFELKSQFKPTGDQPQAIAGLTDGLINGHKYQTLLGVTGSGKTYTMANVIEEVQKPTLVISHNKTLAMQLYTEFQTFFPENSVNYFVSPYDFYQPEAYLPITDQYFSKKCSRNEAILYMRHKSTASLLERRDTIVVASSSCIFGLGSPAELLHQKLELEVGKILPREQLLRRLVHMQYDRTDGELEPGMFKVKGEIVQVYPIEAENPYRIELFGNEIDRIVEITPQNENLKSLDSIRLFPTELFSFDYDKLLEAIPRIQAELDDRVAWFRKENKMLEAERLYERVTYDLTMMKETGRCKGIENYAYHLYQLKPGEPQASLFNFFPQDYLLFIDESHVTLPQLKAMQPASHTTKTNLIDHGFRLPSAIHTRPLTFDEMNTEINQSVFVSATPDLYEFDVSEQVIEQIIRPTGLIDPKIEVYRGEDRMFHMIDKISEHTKEKNNQVLISAFSKVGAERLTDYLNELGVSANYLHGDLELLEREIVLSSFKKGEFDVLVGINLLREGLDLPEVSLVAILDADQKGFLRSTTSLIQTSGRAARNVDGEVVFYAHNISDSMEEAIFETDRRRDIQMLYNEVNNITPTNATRNR